MIEALAPVVGIPSLVAAAWTVVGLRSMGSPNWALGGVVAAALAAALVIIAAFLPLIGFFGALGVPVLCVAGGLLLLRLFARLYAVAVALSVPFALLIALQPPLFPLLLPLVLVLPTWTVGWIEREQGTGKFALTILAALIAVPVAVFGAFFLVRGS
jgi:membrane-bound ClpP family serine protease